MTITKEQVFAAAERLDESGDKPTVQAVRAQVGGGSFTTLSAWLQDWRVRRAADDLVSHELDAARARIRELESSRRDLQARLQVMEIALLTTRRLLELADPQHAGDGSERPARRHWDLTAKSN